jgi:hypothetical protein
LQKEKKIEMPPAFGCPNSRWVVVHPCFITSHPSVDSHTVSALPAGEHVTGAYVHDGWLKVAPAHSPGWIKLHHEPFGTLIRRDDGGDEGETQSLSRVLSARAIMELHLDGRRSEYGRLAEGSTAWATVHRELSEMLLDDPPNVTAGPDFEGADARGFILVQPLCGLCNRLRVLSSALALCKAMGRDLLLQWYPDDEACGCDFWDLFGPHDEIVIWPLAAPPPRGARALRLDEPAWEDASVREAVIRGRLPATCGGRPTGPADAHKLREQLRSRCLVIRTCADFFPADGLEHASSNACRPVTSAAIAVRSAALRSLVPLSSIAARLLPALRETYAERRELGACGNDRSAGPKAAARRCGIVGVHIRRGDNLIAIETSPLELFVRWMEAAVSCDDSIRFFLSTDCAATEMSLLERFGRERVLVQGAPPHTRSRSTPEGIRSALVDLLSLASTDRVVGTHYSSFSTLAATWYGTPLEVLANGSSTS